MIFGTRSQIGALQKLHSSGSIALDLNLSCSTIPFKINVRGDEINKIVCRASTAIPKDGPSLTAKYVRNTVKGGTVEESSGSLLVFGDVKRGSTVLAVQDIIITGRLEGEAHAGMGGDRNAVIVANVFMPSQAKIADVSAFAVRNRLPPGYPEIASLDQRSLTIKLEPAAELGRSSFWQPSNPLPPSQASCQTGYYILAAGLSLILAPASTFGILFDSRLVATGWIRVGGVLASLFGIYYLGAAYGDDRGWGADGFYWATVIGRVLLFGAFSAIVAAGELPTTLMILGLINLWGALNMAKALNRVPEGAAS